MVKFKWGALEVFKFTLYLSIPVSLTVGFVHNPERLDRLTKAYAYVDHPPAGPPPPTLEEIKAMLAQEKKNKAALEKKAKKGWLW